MSKIDKLLGDVALLINNNQVATLYYAQGRKKEYDNVINTLLTLIESRKRRRINQCSVNMNGN